MLSGLNLYSFDLFGWLFRSRNTSEVRVSEPDEETRVGDRVRHEERFYFFGMFPMM